jgi:predicted regulator of Ras-like GTPase activity (Roadblock/LC7/MglB family)
MLGGAPHGRGRTCAGAVGDGRHDRPGSEPEKESCVEGAVIISRDGVVFTTDMEVDAEKEGAVAVFLGNAAGQVGEALNLTPFDWGLLTMGEDTVLTLERPSFFVGLLLSEKVSPAVMRAEEAKVLD